MLNRQIGVYGKSKAFNLNLYKLLKKNNYLPILSESSNTFFEYIKEFDFDFMFFNSLNREESDLLVVDNILTIKPNLNIICIINKDSNFLAHSLFKLGVVDIIFAPFNYENLINKLDDYFNSLT